MSFQTRAQESLGDLERLRDVLYGYHGNEGAKFLYKSWRLGYVADEALRHVILEAWKHSWPMFALRQLSALVVVKERVAASGGHPNPRLRDRT